jgi:hypothetical protein
MTRTVSKRTKDALVAAKKRGQKLGGGHGANLTTKARKAGNAAVVRKAAARAANLVPMIRELQERGFRSLQGIAAGLNQAGVPTARGDGKWSAVQVDRVLKRLPSGSTPRE